MTDVKNILSTAQQLVVDGVKRFIGAADKTLRRCVNSVVKIANSVYDYLYGLSRILVLFVALSVFIVLFATWQICAYSFDESTFIVVNLSFVAIFALLLFGVMITVRNILDKNNEVVHQKNLQFRKKEQELRSLKSELMELKTSVRHQQTFGLKSQAFVEAVIQNKKAAQPTDPAGQYIIKALSQCYEICGGVIYLKNADNRCVLAGSFALIDEPKIVEVVEGEGLLGQALSTGNVMHVNDVEDDYLSVLSGLGSTKTVIISILPLKRDKEVIGVIEISSFGKLGLVDIWNDISVGLSQIL